MTTATPQRQTAASVSLDDLGRRAQTLAEARNQLATVVGALNEGIELLKVDALPEVSHRIGIAANAWAALQAAINANPHLFVKPRKVSMHGIQFGVEKGKGAIEITDPEETVRLIRRKMPELADVLIATRDVPVKKAIAGLNSKELRAIGVTVTDATDQVVIRPENSSLDKLVKALMKAAVTADATAEADE